MAERRPRPQASDPPPHLGDEPVVAFAPETGALITDTLEMIAGEGA